MEAIDKSQTEPAAKSYFERVKNDLFKSGDISVARIEPLRQSLSLAVAVFDEVGILLAQEYHEGKLDFELADWLANTLNGEMMDLMIALQPNNAPLKIPPYWSEVYEAFDAGEFDHFGRSKDPVGEFTNPGIASFLERIKAERPTKT